MDFLKSKIWPVNPCKFFWQYLHNTWFWYMDRKLEKIKSRQDGCKTGWMQKRLDERRTYPLGREPHDQRIYIYKEYKANSPRLYTGAFHSRKQEAVRKTTPELLSAVMRSLLCGGVCVLYFNSILCTLYSRVGQFFRF